jgi:hypothetical protein
VDNPRLRISSCGALLWRADQLVWHDTLAHRRFALGEDADIVLRCFTTWQPLSHVRKRARDEDHAQFLVNIAERLRAANVLITRESERHRVEDANEAAWRRWGRLAALFHTDTRNLRDQRFLTGALDQQRLRQRLDHEPPPPVCREVPTPHRVALAEAELASWARSDFLDVLSHRRSSRRFSGEPVPFEAISGCVVFFTCVLARSMWKYSTPRTYRMLHLDVGHLSQTVYLLAAALGLGVTFIAAIQDEKLEDLLGIDATQELVMGCSVIGIPTRTTSIEHGE